MRCVAPDDVRGVRPHGCELGFQLPHLSAESSASHIIYNTAICSSHSRHSAAMIMHF